MLYQPVNQQIIFLINGNSFALERLTGLPSATGDNVAYTGALSRDEILMEVTDGIHTRVTSKS